MLIAECTTDDILSCLKDQQFEGKETVAEAIDLGWKPDVNAAIESYYTVCAELEIGEGYAEHLMEAHPHEEVVQALAPIFADQAESFLAEHEPALLWSRTSFPRNSKGDNRTMRTTTKEDLKPIVDEKPALARIFRALLNMKGFQSTEQVAKEAGLPVELTQEALDFLEDRCEKGGFENPITPRMRAYVDFDIIPTGTRVFERMELEASVKRTKRWWKALDHYERSFIVCVEKHHRNYRPKDRRCPKCMLHLAEDYMVSDRGLCQGCAARYNKFITKANFSLEP